MKRLLGGLLVVLLLAGCAVGEDEGPDQPLLDELGEIIVAAGTFWEDWWYATGRFADENIDFGVDALDHLGGSLYWPLLPSSGFGSLADIRDYLLKYYTESWVDAMLEGDFPPFIEYGGGLYVHVARAGLSITRWETAVHALLEQGDGYVVIKTSAFNSAWHMLPNLAFCGDRDEFLREAQEQITRGETYINPDTPVEQMISEVFFRIVFVDSRIDCVDGWGIFGR